MYLCELCIEMWIVNCTFGIKILVNFIKLGLNFYYIEHYIVKMMNNKND